MQTSEKNAPVNCVQLHGNALQWWKVTYNSLRNQEALQKASTLQTNKNPFPDSSIPRGCLLVGVYVPCINHMPGGVSVIVGDSGLCCCVHMVCVRSIVRALLTPFVCCLFYTFWLRALVAVLFPWPSFQLFSSIKHHEHVSPDMDYVHHPSWSLIIYSFIHCSAPVLHNTTEFWEGSKG